MLILLQLFILLVLVLIALVLFFDERKEHERKQHLVKVKSFWNKECRRKVYRHPVSLDVNYSVQQQVGSAKTCDISTHGIGLILDEKFQKGTLLDLKVFPRNMEHPIKAKAEVMWVKEAFEDEKGTDKRLFYTGIKFVCFDCKDHENSLFEYVQNFSSKNPLPENVAE